MTEHPKILIMPDGTELEVAPGISDEDAAAIEAGDLQAAVDPINVIRVHKAPVRFVRLDGHDAMTIAQAFKWIAEGRGFVTEEETKVLRALHESFVKQKTMAVPATKKRKRRRR